MTFYIDNVFEIHKNRINKLSSYLNTTLNLSSYLTNNINNNNIINKSELFIENDVYNIIMYDNLVMISLNSMHSNSPYNDVNEIFNYLKTIIFDHHFIPITYYNKIKTNINSKKYLENLEKNDSDDTVWKQLLFSQSYDGPNVHLFYNSASQNWIISSDNSLVASDKITSFYSNSLTCNITTIKDIFFDIFNDPIEISNLFDDIFDRSLCYTFTILHNKYKNIIQYNNFGNDYKELLLSFISINGLTESSNPIENKINKYTKLSLNNHIDKIICQKTNIRLPSSYNFSCFNEFDSTIEKINYDISIYSKISMEGYIIYDPTENIIFKMQTNMFNYINKYKSQYSNIHQLFLNLYQKDKLTEIIPFFSKYSNEIIHRINMSMKTIAREILNIYHVTRQKNNRNIYNVLTDQYRQTLYGVHGIYIKKRSSEFNYKNYKNDSVLNFIDRDINIDYDIESCTDINLESKSISVHDIYYHMKNIHFDHLLQIFTDRQQLITNTILTSYFDVDCIFTITQSKLMFLNT